MMALRIVQLNCQRSCAVMNDLSAVLLREGVNVALLQELYVAKDRVCGLSSSWRVYACRRAPAKAAVVVCDESVEAICVSECTDEYGVCACACVRVCACVVEEEIRGVVCCIHVLSVRL